MNKTKTRTQIFRKALLVSLLFANAYASTLASAGSVVSTGNKSKTSNSDRSNRSIKERKDRSSKKESARSKERGSSVGKSHIKSYYTESQGNSPNNSILEKHNLSKKSNFKLNSSQSSFELLGASKQSKNSPSISRKNSSESELELINNIDSFEIIQDKESKRDLKSSGKPSLLDLSKDHSNDLNQSKLSLSIMKNDEPSFSNSLAGGAEKAQNHSIEYKKPDSQKEIAAKSLLKSSENKQGSKLSNSIKPEANTVNNNTQHALIMSDSMVAATKNDENKNNKDEKKEESAHISTKQPESKLVNRPSVSSSGKSSPENEKNPDVEQARKKDLEERIKNKGGEENKKSVKNFGPPMKKPENKRDFKQENDAGKKNHEEKKYAKNHALEAGRAHAILAQSAPEPIAITNIVKSSTLTKTNENRDSNKAQGAENNVAQQRTTKTVSFSKPKTLNYKTSSTQTTTQAEMAKKITSKAERSKLTAIKPTQQKQTSPAESEKVAHERKLNINYRHDGTSERDHRVRSKSVRKTMRHSDKNSKRKKPTIYPN